MVDEDLIEIWVKAIRDTMTNGTPLESCLATFRGPMLRADPSGELIGIVRQRCLELGGHGEGQLWSQYRESLIAQGADFVDSLDESSTKVLAHVKKGLQPKAKVRGLVLGHVQSGKTANITATAAKAIDHGYRMVIVFAGQHNKLRSQTQRRIQEELGRGGHVVFVTDDEEDFRRLPGTAAVAMFRSPSPVIAVVKKNAARLQALRDELKAVSAQEREKYPILLIDDEADQATPNGARDADLERTAINGYMREIWGLVESGAYVAYTATPFANVFIDPTDEGDFYPDDFIITLPLSPHYFGASRVFGRPGIDEPDEMRELDILRFVTEEEAQIFKGFGAGDGLAIDEPPHALKQAIHWFIVACAIRRSRGDGGHCTMMLHTSHLTTAHSEVKHLVDRYVRGLTASNRGFKVAFDEEVDRVATERSAPRLTWEEVSAELPRVLARLKVVEENSTSRERLDYDEDGGVFIVIGGNVLSRGLTLEGLMVSYFLREPNNYDTLMQMGRWFGYRPGYEDLQRIWTLVGTAADFRYLALVEEEIRERIEEMIDQGLTPSDIAVRVRLHPGHLSITSKMGVAKLDPGLPCFGGTTSQTTRFKEHDREWIRKRAGSVREFLSRVGMDAFERVGTKNASRLARNVDPGLIAAFAREIADGNDGHDGEYARIADWIMNKGGETCWNVALVSPRRGTSASFDVSHGLRINCIRRAPFARRSGSEWCDIGALISPSDLVIDLEDAPSVPGWSWQRVRHDNTSDGLVLIYAIDPESQPSASATKSRRAMEAADVLLGVAIAFPDIDQESDRGQYMSVQPSLGRSPQE